MMGRIRLLISSLLGALLVEALQSPVSLPTSTTTSPGAVHLRVVHLNDVYKLDHLPKFKGLVDSLKNRDDGVSHCICTLGGDFFSPSLLSSMDQGKAMVACLSEFVDYACLGNHEADLGPAAFCKNIDRFKGTVINSNFPVIPKATPEAVTLSLTSRDETHGRRVTLLGLLEPSPNLYLPNAFGPGAVENAIPIPDCLREHLKSAKEDDMILPLTHQDVDLDVALARDFGCPQRMPLVLGGHDHDPFDIPVPSLTDERCRVLKAGMDGEQAIVVDIVWESASTLAPKIQVEFVDITALPDTYIDSDLAAKVDHYHTPLRQLGRTVLKVLESRELALSSIGIRKQQTTMGSLICTAIRKALRADVAVMNGGCIRGNSVYTSCIEEAEEGQRFFTFSDLLKELPFDTETCVVGLPGQVLEEAIEYSRNCGGGFLQCCNEMDVVQEPCGRYKILQIRGEPFDPNRIYNVATHHHLLTGMDDIQPLVQYARENAPEMPPLDATRPAKELVLQVYYREIWLMFGSFEEIVTGGSNAITRAQLGAALAAKLGFDPTDVFVGETLRAFDFNEDGVVSRAEYESGMHAIRRNRFDLSPSDCKGIVQVMDVVKYLNMLLQDPTERMALDNHVIPMEEFEAGSTILQQGDKEDFLYFCEQGTINFIADGKEVGSCGHGGSFGELALLYDSPRAATCVAATDCKLWRVDRSAFRYLLVQAANRHNQQVMSVIKYITRALKDPKERLFLEQVLNRKEKKAGEIIIHQGDVGDCLYFCESGRVQFLADEKEVGCATSGGSFGELALLYDTPRAATCLALTDCELWKVDRPAFHQLLERAAQQQKLENLMKAMPTSSSRELNSTATIKMR